MPGPRPKPTAQKILEGNPGRRPLNPNEPNAVAGLPECPPHLCAEGKREWKRMGEQLVREKRIALVYKAAFAAYCQSWGRWVRAERELRHKGMIVESPNGFLQPSPWLGISNKALAFMQKAIAELGLSPTSQARVSKVTQGATVSKFEAFMGGKTDVAANE